MSSFFPDYCSFSPGATPQAATPGPSAPQEEPAPTPSWQPFAPGPALGAAAPDVHTPLQFNPRVGPVRDVSGSQSRYMAPQLPYVPPQLPEWTPAQLELLQTIAPAELPGFVNEDQRRQWDAVPVLPPDVFQPQPPLQMGTPAPVGPYPDVFSPETSRLLERAIMDMNPGSPAGVYPLAAQPMAMPPSAQTLVPESQPEDGSGSESESGSDSESDRPARPPVRASVSAPNRPRPRAVPQVEIPRSAPTRRTALKPSEDLERDWDPSVDIDEDSTPWVLKGNPQIQLGDKPRVQYVFKNTQTGEKQMVDGSKFRGRRQLEIERAQRICRKKFLHLLVLRNLRLDKGELQMGRATILAWVTMLDEHPERV